jgi:hypothetical protein
MVYGYSDRNRVGEVLGLRRRGLERKGAGYRSPCFPRNSQEENVEVVLFLPEARMLSGRGPNKVQLSTRYE